MNVVECHRMDLEQSNWTWLSRKIWPSLAKVLEHILLLPRPLKSEGDHQVPKASLFNSSLCCALRWGSSWSECKDLYFNDCQYVRQRLWFPHYGQKNLSDLTIHLQYFTGNMKIFKGTEEYSCVINDANVEEKKALWTKIVGQWM